MLLILLKNCKNVELFPFLRALTTLSKDSTDIAATTADDIAATADCDDSDMLNNMLFDYMYGSSPESADGSDSSDSSDSEDDKDQYIVAPDPSELVLCCTDIKSHKTDGESAAFNSENFLSQRALHSVDLCKLSQAKCQFNCRKECIEHVGLAAIKKLRSRIWFERGGKRRSQIKSNCYLANLGMCRLVFRCVGSPSSFLRVE
jgi:hypothetical protein